MTSRDLVIKTLNHEPIYRIPRDLWCLPGVETAHAEELAELEIRFPRDIVRPDFKYPAGKRAKGKPFRVGRYTDAWGCTWRVAERGETGELADSPLADPAKIAEYEPPFELVERGRFARVNPGCAATSRFVLAWTATQPLRRLRLLRGAKAALADLAHGTKRIRDLLEMVHDFSRREMETWAETDVDGVVFTDDWGSRDGQPILPQIWRDLFRPLYRDYCKILHGKDKFAFFHCHGDVSSIFGDLVQVGMDAIGCQMSVTDFERLAKRFRGRVTFWGQLDGQEVLVSATPEEIREAVLRVRRALDFGSGGVIAQCAWPVGAPVQNIMAVFQQWALPLPMHAV